MAIAKEMGIDGNEPKLDFNDPEIFKNLKQEFEENTDTNDDDDDEDSQTVEVDEDGNEIDSQTKTATETDTEDDIQGIGQTDDDNTEDIPNAKIPRVKYVEEKKKRQAIEAENEALRIQLQELKGDTQEKEFNDYYQAKKQKYINMGYEEDLATGFAEDMLEQYKMVKGISKSEPKESPVDKELLEIMKLKTESEYYDNADAFKKEIKEKMVKFGVTAKTAYNMIVEPESRQKELIQRQRAKGLQGGSDKSQTTVSSNAGAKRPDTIQLSKKDMEVFKILRDGDPTWTLERYRKRINK